MIHSFLMIGQSNMAGRGFKEEVEPIVSSDLLMLVNGRWEEMRVPVNYDRADSGVSLAESFALEYAKDHPGVKVGLIPCADGGTEIAQWRQGSLLFDNAIYNVRLADRTSSIAGVLWHQGETDVMNYTKGYKEKLIALIAAFREEPALRDLPFITGGLGLEFLKKFDKSFVEWGDRFNDTVREVAAEIALCGFASADGLTSNPDNLHFNAGSLRELGRRYYAEFRRLEDKGRAFTEKSSEDDAVRNPIELL